MLSNTTTNLLRTQYYDDFYAPSETDDTLLRGDEFDFHRVLFRPRYPVQSRELTQLQTVLQAQLERFGKSAFRDGEAVLGGQLTLDTSVVGGKVLPATNLVAFFSRTTNDGKYVFDSANTAIRAHVLQYAAADEDGTSDNYLMFKYQAAGEFSPGTVIQATDDALVTATFASEDASEVFSTGSIISIDEGVFFVSGFFVRVRQQTILLNPFSSRPSYRIGLEINEEILDELDDVVGDTLLDPANQNAPGAHRFRVGLTLAKRAISSSADAGFIELARVIDGVVQQTKKTPRFVRVDELTEILARRTHDESGDYIVRPFAPILATDPDTESNFILSLGPGKAYVRGFEVETSEPTNLYIRKGRVTANVTNRNIPTRVGNYVYALRVGATAPATYFANTSTVDIHCVNVSSIDTTSSTTYERSKIGTAKVRLIETFSVPANTALHGNNSIYKLFFHDVQYTSLTGNVTSAALSNLAIVLSAPVANGMPAVNGAIDGATIILSGDDSPVTGTFTVNNYSANSTVAQLTLREFLPTLPNGNTSYKLLFQQRDIDAFAAFDAAVTTAPAPLAAKLAFQAEVDAKSKRTGTPVGNTVVSDTTNNGLLYAIPERFVKANTLTTNTAVFVSWVKTTANSQLLAATNTTFTLTVSGTGFTLPTGDLSAEAAQRLLVVFDQTADATGRGRILQFTDTPGSSACLSNVSVAAVGQSYNITLTYFNATNATTRSLVGLARTTVVGLEPRQKTLIVGNTTAVLSGTTGALNAGQIEFHTLNATAGFAYSLKTADVYQIRKIYYKDSNTAFANTDLSTATDVTSLFTLDTGQRDNAYEYSRLIASSRASGTIRPTGRLLVIFDWFQHTGRGYVTLDSYLSDTNITRGMSYDEIPEYTSAKFNQTSINLRDVLDFRPVRSNYEFTAAALIYAADDASSNTTYLTSAGESYLMPVSDEEWLGSYSHYLGRVDKIALGFDGTFRVIEGLDAVTPKPPADDSGSLQMFQLTIPAYTEVDENGVPEDVSLATFEHKRFTMQDLSKIDNRVAHLEYYTALNSLERITRDQTEMDADGNERFKNGILVDSFHGAGVADVAREDFTASIDSMNRELHTAFRTFVMQFSPDTQDTTSTGVTVVGDMAIPTYTTVSFISQPLATRAVSVNPFDVASFYGFLKMSPAVDVWKETNQLPAQVIDMGGPTEAWVKANLPSYTVWGEWNQTWSGVTNITPRYNWAGGGRTENWDDVENSTIYERQGETFEYEVSASSTSVGNRTVDVSVVHRMRPRDVVFSAEGLKPQANLFAFFDGTDVQNYVQQATVLELATLSVTTTEPFYIGQTVYVKKAVTGTVSCTNGNTTISGANSAFAFEVVPGQLVRIEQGVNTFDGFVANVASNTSLDLTTAVSGYTLAAATLSTLTPVTIASIAPRFSGNNVTYTVKVARAQRDADADSAVAYKITAGSLRPEKHVNDTANTTTGAVLLIPNTPRSNAASINIESALCKSGVVRAWNSGTAELRLDTDITDSAVETPNTVIYFVSGSGAGESARVLSYNASTQTATVDTSDLTIVANATIYSVGTPVADGFLESIAGHAGTFAGVLHIPSGTFATGTRNLRLTDSATNGTDATTTAEGRYEASGMSQTQQETVISSRQVGLRRLGPASESLRMTSTTRENYVERWVDPLAETFLVDAAQFPQGVFITSVDLCFAAVPDDDIPVIVEIRPVVNGYPSSHELVPCVSSEGVAIASLRPDQVRTTDAPAFDTTVHTRFTFAAPVHLMGGREYALVVRSDSNLYTVYTAELGQTVIGSTAIVAKQPYAGSFFKSQNASTWTESPFEDMMFRLNRADWTGTASVPQTGVLVTRAIAPAANTLLDSMEFFPHEVQFSDETSATYTLDIKPYNSDTEDLTGQTAVRYSIFPNEWRPLDSRSMVQGYGSAFATGDDRPLPFASTRTIAAANTVDCIATLKTYSAHVAPYVDLKKMNLLGVQHLINDMGLQAEDVIILSPGAGYLANLQTGLVTTTATSPNVTGDANTDFVSTMNVGDTLVVGGNLALIVASITNTTHLVATANAGFARAANTFYRYGAKSGNNAVTLTIADGNGSDAAGYATIGGDGAISGIVITEEGSGYTETPTVTVPAPEAVAGYTITQSTGSLEYNSELAASGGNALTRYITRSVTLANGFDARDITVYFDAYRPAGSKFHVYYKVLAGDADSERFEDQAWRLMEQETSDSVVSTHYNQWKEFKFKTPDDRALDSADDSTDKFKVWAIKVVVASDDTTDVPRIANFRAIALDQ